MKHPMRITAIVFVAFGLLAQVSCAFQTPFLPHSSCVKQPQSGDSVRYGTSLHMGLRTFIKTKLGRDKDENGGESPKGSSATRKKKKKPKTAKTAALSTEKPKGISIPKQPVKAKIEEVDVTVTKKKDQRLPPLRQESVKARLNRVRSGQMTDDEKQAFLKTALSAGDTSTSRKPLRQKLPDESRPANSTGNATPYPKDSLLTNMARGWGNGQNSTENDLPLRNWKDGAQLEDQKKKREYFDMVTDPNRFHTYKGSMVTAPGETDKVDPSVHDGIVLPQMGDDDEEAEQELILEEEVIEDIKAYEQLAQVEGDLGTRLEQAAHALEEAAKQKEIERKKKEAELEKQRREQKARLAEIQKKQQFEMEKRELELKAKKREEEEVMTREMERRRKEEEARRRKLEEVQDAYWAKQLEAEKHARMQGMSQKQKDEFVKHEVKAEEKAMEIAEHEKEALEVIEKGAQKSDVVEARIDIAAVDYLKKETSKPGPDTYEAKRQQKRLESEQAKDEQIARLKALNSPLPAPSSRGPPTASPVVPPASFARRGASELSNLTNQPEPAPAPPAEMPKAEPTVADMMNDVDDDEDVEEVVAVESSAGSGFLSRVLGSSSSKKKESSAASAPKAPPEPKRIVRQELPLGDEESDFDTFDRNSPSRKMSIADAMSAAGESTSGGDQEQRSKKWGVDMTRIAKSLEEEKKNE